MLRIRATVVKELNGTVYTVFTQSAGRFSSHVTLNSMISWEMSKQLVWDFTVVDALTPSRLISVLYVTRELPPPRLERVKMKSIENY